MAKKKRMVYNVSLIDETLAGNNIRVDSFKDGVAKTNGKQFSKLSDAIYWITEINMVAHCAKDVQINLNLNK